MEEKKEQHVCFNCGQSENTAPLVSLTYKGKPQWVCTQCLPQVIHHLENVISKLEAAK